MKEIGIAGIISLKRRELGITQEELAGFIGVTKASVSKWETGLSYPDIELLPRLAVYFNITVDELLNYTPQLTKEQIKRLYHELREKFESGTFKEALKECDNIIKKYYSCYPFLLQMVVLYINHHMLAESKEEAQKLLEDARLICERIKHESEDMYLSNQAVHIEAVIYQLQGKPEEVLELLGEEINPRFSADELIITAFRMKGNEQNAKKLSQISIYNNLTELLSMLQSCLNLYSKDKAKTEEIINRACGIIEIFNLESIQSNLSAIFYYQAAVILMRHGERARSLDMLNRYTDVCVRELNNFKLHGDEFFDLLEAWFEDFDLGNKAPRSQKSINEDMLAGLLNTAEFKNLGEEKSFKEMVRRLEKLVNEN